MNKNFNNFVESQLHINETDFDFIILNLPRIIRNNKDLDFSEYDSEDNIHIERYLIDRYILNPHGLAAEDIDCSTKTVWIFSYNQLTLDELNKVKEELENWSIANYEEIFESVKN